MSDVTRILSQIESGDPPAAEQLLPLVYDELRKLAAAKLAHEKPGQTLQATALVHEAYLRLVGGESGVSRGTAAAISSPPRPRRCGGFWSSRPGGKSGPKQAAGDRRVELSNVAGASRRRPTDLLALDEALDQAAAEATPSSRAGQAAILRRPDHRRGGRGPGHLRRNCRR